MTDLTMPHTFDPPDDDDLGLYCRCGRVEGNGMHAVPVAQSAVEMNAVGSETGRVTTAAPDTSVAAARRTKAGSHRETIHKALEHAGSLRGMTSIEAAAILPLTAQGFPQVSNRSASRLGELWEEGRATIKRENGMCTLGVCHEHEKPNVIHKPSAPCGTHGKPVTRGGAAVWIAL